MADSKQLRILKKLSTHLEGVNPDNGYTYDLRDKIVRGKSVIPVDQAEDVVSILEFPRQDIYAPVGEHGIVRQESWMLMLQGWPEDDPENPSDPAYLMKAEVEHRLARLITENPNGRGPKYPEEFMLGEHNGKRELLTLTIAPGVVRPPEDAASRLAMFYVPLVLGVKINVADPFETGD